VAGVCLATVVLLSRDMAAQLIALKDGPVVMGHVGLNSTSTEAHKKFWSALGGMSVAPFKREMFQFPNIYVSPGHGSSPKGGTVGTTVDHLAFRVPELRAALRRMSDAGYLPLTSDDAARHAAFFMGPDDIKVELVEVAGMPFPVAVDHVHFAGPDPAAMRDWYVRVLDAKAGQRGSVPAAELPGVTLLFEKSGQPVVATAGRVLDHVTFEVRGLMAFCEKLERAGVRLDKPYSRAGGLDLGVAFLTDPWGTSVELTEGYDKIAR
jgi:catechol 2,3-dioxygenase-like lactoylglutathione lyase family enzyme